MLILKHILCFIIMLAVIPLLTAKIFFYFSSSAGYAELLETARAVFVFSAILYYLASRKIIRPEDNTLFIIYLIGFYLLLYSGTLMII